MSTLHKYPRTRHLEGSRLQPGDSDLSAVPFAEVRGQYLVCEEKLDGANTGLSLDEEGRLRLQSRGHFLTGGDRERQFNLFKQWAHTHADSLRAALGTRYVLYGEWTYAKHTIFYDLLPHYFHEFDLFDQQTGGFLSTPRRQEVLARLPIVSVPVLHAGPIDSLEELTALIGPSGYRSDRWLQRLAEVAGEREVDPTRIARETDPSGLMEGLYIKHEEGDRVVGRYKYVRPSFLTSVLDSGSHWLKRPIVPNQLAPGVNLFGGTG